MGDKVAEVRKKFLEKYNGSILDDTYDERDVDWVREDDRIVQTVTSSYKARGDVNKAVDLLNEVLCFRAKLTINDLVPGMIHSYYSGGQGMHYIGKDKQGHPVLYVPVKRGKKGFEVEDSRKWVSYSLNLSYRKDPSLPITLLYDFTGATVSNWDIESSKFFSKALNTYFPGAMGVALLFKMPKPLEAVYKLVLPLMDEHQKKNTHFVSRKTIQNFISADQLPAHMIKPVEENK